MQGVQHDLRETQVGVGSQVVVKATEHPLALPLRREIHPRCRNASRAQKPASLLKSVGFPSGAAAPESGERNARGSTPGKAVNAHRETFRAGE